MEISCLLLLRALGALFIIAAVALDSRLGNIVVRLMGSVHARGVGRDLLYLISVLFSEFT